MSEGQKHMKILILTLAFFAVIPQGFSATSDSLISQSTICLSADGAESVQVFVKSVFPTQASLVVNAAFFNSTLSYLVQDLVGKYDEKNKATVFSYLVDGKEVDISIPDSISEQAVISSPTSQTQYKLSCKI